MSSADVWSYLDYLKLKEKFSEALQTNLSTELAIALRDWGVTASERTYNQLFFRDDMENYNLRKFVLNTPADLVVAYTNAAPAQGVFEGNYCLSFASPTNRYGEVSITFGCFKQQKIAIELRWFRRQGTQRFIVGMGRYQSSSGHFAAVRWNESHWQYRDSTGTYQDITNGEETIRNNVWNYLRITVDWENLCYYRLKTNLLDLDLTGLTPQSSTSTAGQFQILIAHYAISTAALPYGGYIDDFRIYLNAREA